MRRLVHALVEEGRTDLYYLSTHAEGNGDFLIHRAGCEFMPRDLERRYVGRFDNSFQALRDARQFRLQSNGCAVCLPECHLK